MTAIFDFAVTTIFAREVLEGSIIIGEYRTVILRSEEWPQNIGKKEALRAVTVSASVASLVALLVIAIVAIPLAILSKDFDPRVSSIIEGVSKIVAAICILQLSLKVPKFLGLYRSKKTSENVETLTLSSIRLNVAWNIWREVAECGIFLLPSFLTGQGIMAIPFSAVVGTAVGLLCGLGVYYANKKLTNKVWLAIFTTVLLLFLSTGLFSGGCHNIEKATSSTAQVWSLSSDFWSVDRLPMTILKPFGYSDTRTVLQIVCFWVWLAFGVLLHYRKYRQSQTLVREEDETAQPSSRDASRVDSGDDRDIEMNCVEEKDDSGKVTLVTQDTIAMELSFVEATSRFR